MSKFNGTSVSREHIGDKQSENLEALVSTTASEFADLSLTAGAEAGDAIGVAVQAKSLNGDDLAEALQLHVRVYDANMIEAAAAAATVAAGGGAALDTAAAQAAALLTLGSDGAGTVTITDASGALAGDLIVEFSVVGRPGVTEFLTLTYA